MYTSKCLRYKVFFYRCPSVSVFYLDWKTFFDIQAILKSEDGMEEDWLPPPSLYPCDARASWTSSSMLMIGISGWWKKSPVLLFFVIGNGFSVLDKEVKLLEQSMINGTLPCFYYFLHYKWMTVIFKIPSNW